MGPAQIWLKISASIAWRETYRMLPLSTHLFSHWSIPLILFWNSCLRGICGSDIHYVLYVTLGIYQQQQLGGSDPITLIGIPDYRIGFQLHLFWRCNTTFHTSLPLTPDLPYHSTHLYLLHPACPSFHSVSISLSTAAALLLLSTRSCLVLFSPPFLSLSTLVYSLSFHTASLPFYFTYLSFYTVPIPF